MKSASKLARPVRVGLDAEALLSNSGLSAQRVAQRKAFLEFGADDVRRLAALAPRAAAYADEVIDALYTHFLNFAETREFLRDPARLKRLKVLQKRYFLRLTSGRYGMAYVRNRLLVGAIHERIGLGVEFYLGAYRRYLYLVSRRLWRPAARHARFDAFQSLLKIVFLDIGLAIDTYILRRERTIRKQNQELARQFRKLQAANLIKNEFLANMSHELRTPLNSIIGFAELFHDGKLGPLAAPQKKYISDMLLNARHLLELIDGTLDLARIESGTMTLHPERVDVAAILEEVRRSFETLAAEKRIRLCTIADCRRAPIVDRVRIKQVLFNYVSNAIKFTPPGGEVTVRMCQQGGDLLDEVKDNGIGIDRRDLKRLFVEFQQLDHGPAKKYQGTGLGLAITKRLVEAHGGTVGVRSKPGAGSTFFAHFPMNGKASKGNGISEYWRPGLNGNANLAGHFQARLRRDAETVWPRFRKGEAYPK